MTQVAEEWKPVVGLEDYYQVSADGRIRSIAKRKGTKVGRILKQSLSGPKGKERYYVRLCVTASRLNKNSAVHRVVAHAFIGPCPDGYEVNHADGNRYNNRSSNLEYVTPQENVLHSVRHSLRRYRLSIDDIKRIRIRLEAEKPAPIARHYQVEVSTICAIRDRLTWAWLE